MLVRASSLAGYRSFLPALCPPTPMLSARAHTHATTLCALRVHTAGRAVLSVPAKLCGALSKKLHGSVIMTMAV